MKYYSLLDILSCFFSFSSLFLPCSFIQNFFFKVFAFYSRVIGNNLNCLFPNSIDSKMYNFFFLFKKIFHHFLIIILILDYLETLVFVQHVIKQYPVLRWSWELNPMFIIWNVFPVFNVIKSKYRIFILWYDMM